MMMRMKYVTVMYLDILNSTLEGEGGMEEEREGRRRRGREGEGSKRGREEEGEGGR